MIGLGFWMIAAALAYGTYISYSEYGKVALPAGVVLILFTTGYVTGFQYGSWGFVVVPALAGVVYASNALAKLKS